LQGNSQGGKLQWEEKVLEKGWGRPSPAQPCLDKPKHRVEKFGGRGKKELVSKGLNGRSQV